MEKVRRHPALAFALVLLLAALSLGVGFSGPPAAGGASSGNDLAAVEERELAAAISAVEIEARERWSDGFAGMWRTAEGQGPIHVAFTAQAAARVADLAADFPRPDLLQAVTFERSLAQLEAIQAEIAVDREQVRRGALDLEGIADHRYNTDIDQARNVVEVQIKNADQRTRDTFEDRYREAIIVKEGPVGAPGQCSRTDCRYTLRSGLRTDLNSGWCSTAFAVRTGSGVRQLLSASHCGNYNQNQGCVTPYDIGDDRDHGGETYGPVTDDVCTGRVDAERHRPTGDFVAQPWIYVNDANQEARVRSQGSWSGTVVGSTRLCKSGARTDRDCGLVRGKHHSPWWVPNANRFIRASYRANSGDSGSGVYDQLNWARAEGVYSGGFVNVDCDDWDKSASGDWSTGGHIQYALNRLNVSLITAPPGG